MPQNRELNSPAEAELQWPNSWADGSPGQEPQGCDDLLCIFLLYDRSTRSAISSKASLSDFAMRFLSPLLPALLLICCTACSTSFNGNYAVDRL
jgi:hypothetical protein